MSGNDNNMMPFESYNSTQSSGYESMPDQFYSDYPSSQEMGPPPIPNRFQQTHQQPQHMQQQPMDHQHSQMDDNQQWQSQQHSQYHDNRHQQMPQQHFQQQQMHQQQQPSQHNQQQHQQVKQVQQQSMQQEPSPQQVPTPQQQTPQPHTPQPPSSEQSQEAIVPAPSSATPAPSAPQFRIQSQPAAPPSQKASSSSGTGTPQFVINQSDQNSRSSTPTQSDKTRINVLRQQVLHPVDPKIAEKMHKAPALKPRDNAAEMLLRMKDYESVIPDAAAKYMMTRTGTAVDDDICYRMLAISAQKFASDILSDSITIARSRGLGQTNRATKETKYVLTQELLKEVFSEHGIRTFNS
jgi:hypothetical protein